MHRKRLLTALACSLASTLAAGAHAGDSAGVESAPEPGAATAAGVVDGTRLAVIKPGLSKAQVRTSLGVPWRILQFNDCGKAMPDQADETWEYRGSDARGTYRLHIEFDDHEKAHLVARIPDNVAGGKGTSAVIASAPMAMMAHGEHP
jgi:hypothetical protein